MAKQQKNSKTNQISFHLQKKKLKEIGITPNELLDLKIPKNKIKYPQSKNI